MRDGLTRANLLSQQREQIVKRTAWLLLVAVTMRCSVASAQSPAPPDPPLIPTVGAHPRLQIVNQCATNIWAVFTPGGNASQVAAQQNSGDWFRPYAQQEQFIGTGATAEPAAGTMSVTLAAPPNDTSLYFLPGQFIEILTSADVQNSTPGPTAMITGISSSPVGRGTVLTLDRMLTVPQDPGNQGTNGRAEIWVDTLVGAVQIPAQTAYSTNASWVAGDLASPPQQAPAYETSEIISQGMRSATGDIYSQGMMAQSGPWAGQIYSQGMEMPGGDIYSQGTQIMIPWAATNPQPPSVNPSPPPAPPVPPTGNNSITFEIPDKGAPSGRFSFSMGCAKNDTDPFNQSPCTLGAANTELAAINTLAEVSFGCMFSSDPSKLANQSNCAFNPGGTGPSFPNCQANPNAANCGALGTNDYYDVSAVDGFTFPLRVEVKAQSSSVICNNNSGNNPLAAADAFVDGSMLDLSSCPAEDANTIYSTDPAQQQLIAGGISLLTRWNASNQPDPNGQAKACVAPYQWFEQDQLGSPVDTSPHAANCANGSCTSSSYYAAEGCDGTNSTTLMYSCPQHSGPQQRVGPHLATQNGPYLTPDGMYSVHNTNYVRALYALGYKGYTWQFDDGVGLLNCPSSAAIGDPQQYTTYTITVCPSGATNNPAQPAQWVFSPATGTCVLSGPGGGNSYSSLALCQQANMRYLCDDVTKYDPYQVPNALWRADAQATRNRIGYNWPQVRQIVASTPPTCQNHDYSAGISPDFVGTDVKLPLCTYYYGGGQSLCPGWPLGG